jgi:hypothetical protein
MKIALEIDDVLCDTRTYLSEMHRLVTGEPSTEVDWSWAAGLSAVSVSDCRPVPGAPQAVSELVRQGHDLQVVSRRPPALEARTRAWLAGWFVPLARSPLNFSPSAEHPYGIVDADLLVLAEGRFAAEGQRVVLRRPTETWRTVAQRIRKTGRLDASDDSADTAASDAAVVVTA